MFDPNMIVWKGSRYYQHAFILGGLVELIIDVYDPHPTKGNAYQIRIRGLRIEKVGAKLWLENLDAAKKKAVDRLNELSG